MLTLKGSIIDSLKILVIGDIMLDHYLYGDCNRISPEAPVPVVEIKSENYTLGGAGNVVKNLVAFNCSVDIISVVGQDESSQIILNKIADYNLSTDGIINDAKRCTTIKTRVLASNHQLIRLDREFIEPIGTETELIVIKTIEGIIKNYNLVLLSDYNKGFLTESLLSAVFKICENESITTIVDPKGNSFRKYSGVNIIKPNKKEAVVASGINITDNESLEAACVRIKEITNCDDVIVTMSEEGMALYSGNKLSIIPTRAMDVVDVTGAGDTVLAALGLAVATGNTLEQACEFANHAAAVVVSKVGSATATLSEIIKEY